ncbi:NRDE family protein [Puia sp.]|jgi:hypothetical protein|uniref:NRDE family protein n=1 Tax=Puia sp. TaxID=2045100 RepID=UPI002F3EE060
MCTVTFLPGESGVYHLTSNRDEHSGRIHALPPQRYSDIFYPKDPAGGGSWVALKRDTDAGVLLNGAFENHRRLAPYRKSRGLVFLEIIDARDPVAYFNAVCLMAIEPFTVILFISGRLFECRWDGGQKHVKQLDPGRPYIWTSVTLYDEPTRAQRETALADWYRQKDLDTGSILDFHRRAARKGEVATVSITTVRIANGKGKLRYFPLQKESAPSTNPFLIRLKHWEYWPATIIYAPLFFYWIWLSLKARSLFWFSAANPTITHSGFLLESKKQIYHLMPEGSYPKTLYCQKGTRIGQLVPRLKALGLTYPIMAKPDIGQRGMAVQLLKDECQLLRYAARTRVDFLLQEYIDHPLEIGVFYYRMPGQPAGCVTGIVGKQLLTVTGDGRSTVKTLLSRNERYVLQLPALRRALGPALQQVPANGEVLSLAPYGNHSRGAKFTDESHRITPGLQAAIDDLCRRIPGFYFGRLDIRFRDWQSLEAGEAFSVIELNGAGSEPTHIYDPEHSIFFAWREIRRHWDILFAISRANTRQQGLAQMSFGKGIKMLWDYSRHEKLIAG